MGFCNAAEVPSLYTSLHFQGVKAFYNYMPDQETVRFPLYLEQQFNIFRIYVPPGVRQVSVELYVPRDASIATVEHFGTPPEATTNTKAYNTISPVVVPTLEELKNQEMFCSNFGGHITVVSSSTTSFQTSDPKGRWLYVKLLRYGSGGVGLTQVAVDVNVAELKAWYARMTDADWNYIEDVNTPAAQCSPACNTGYSCKNGFCVLNDPTISGKVTDSGGTGISGVTVTSSTGSTTTTSADGSYTLSVTSGSSGTLTPSKSGYTFQSLPFSNVTSSLTLNFIGTVNITRIISLSGTLSFGSVSVGSVKTAILTIANVGNSGMTVSSISYSDGFSGNWSGTIPAGGSQNVTVTFAPTAAQTYSGTITVSSDKTDGTNIISTAGTGIAVNAVISGYVRDSNNVGISGVTMTSSTGVTATTSSDGSYTLSVASGSSGTLTPSKSGYTFQSQSFNNITSSLTLNFTGSLAVYTISGIVRDSADNAISGVTMTSSTGGTTITTSDGSYTLSVTSGSSGTLTPSKSGYTFQSQSFNNITGNLTLNFTGTANTRIISLTGTMSFGSVSVGSVKTAILTIANTGNSEMTVSSISYPDGFSGNWSGIIPAGGSQNVTVTFAPTIAQAYGGTITVNSDKTGGTNTISASGTGTAQNFCLTVDDNLGIMITCAEYKGIRFKFALNYVTASQSPDFYWKGDLSTFGNSTSTDGNCLSVVDDLNLNIPCATYKGTNFGFTLKHALKSDDLFGFYWKMDLTTFTQK
jgi:hypothetical protein